MKQDLNLTQIFTVLLHMQVTTLYTKIHPLTPNSEKQVGVNKANEDLNNHCISADTFYLDSSAFLDVYTFFQNCIMFISCQDFCGHC